MHPICDLQIEYSLISRGIEAEILPTCRELGVGVTAYGVLSRGLLSGHWSKERRRRRTTSAALHRASAARTSIVTSRSSTHCVRRRRAGRDCRSGRDRLGPVAWRGCRRLSARAGGTARRGARRGRPARRRGARRDRGGRARGRGSRAGATRPSSWPPSTASGTRLARTGHGSARAPSGSFSRPRTCFAATGRPRHPSTSRGRSASATAASTGITRARRPARRGRRWLTGISAPSIATEDRPRPSASGAGSSSSSRRSAARRSTIPSSSRRTSSSPSARARSWARTSRP